MPFLAAHANDDVSSCDFVSLRVTSWPPPQSPSPQTADDTAQANWLVGGSKSRQPALSVPWCALV